MVQLLFIVLYILALLFLVACALNVRYTKKKTEEWRNIFKDNNRDDL